MTDREEKRKTGKRKTDTETGKNKYKETGKNKYKETGKRQTVKKKGKKKER
jgi:hypothetical protein